MFSAGTLTFQEFMAREKLPLATIQNALLEFLRGRGKDFVYIKLRNLVTVTWLTFDWLIHTERLQAAGYNQAVLEVWKKLVAQEITPQNEDDEF